MASEPISPELALVCPELAATARAALPDIELDAGPLRRAAPVLAGRGAPLWAYALAYAAASFGQLALWSMLWVAVAAAVTTVPFLF